MSAERQARVKDLFLEACALAHESRGPFLERACGTDRLLREEVEELLANDADPLAFVERAALGEGAKLLASGLAASGGLRAPAGRAAMPERIGRYRILRILGEGGMGVVFEAEQHAPQRRVAIKVIRSGSASPGALRRFEHEVHLLGRLNHPGIAHVYEAGTEALPDGPRPFYAMELIEGSTLTEHARARGLGARERLELFTSVCDAVGHAHQNGVLHRDLKPANILVNGAGEPKVLDFGVARNLAPEASQLTSLTRHGEVIGTLAYMSPEQVSGETAQVDTRSDIYSLGVVAYELLCGHLPYDVLDVPIPKAARRICEVEPQPIGTHDKALRGDLETILATALAKDRERRYASAAELAADVRRYLADQPIIARPASTLYQWSKFARRNKALVAGSSLAVLALLAGTIISSWLARNESRQRRRADHHAAEAGREAYRANVLATGLALGSHNPRYARQLLASVGTSERGWEYGRLQRLTEGWIAEVNPGVGPIWHVAFGPDGRTAVAVAASGAVATWDPASGLHAPRVGADGSRRSPWALSADGSLCVSVSSGQPRAWSTLTGEERLSMRAPATFRAKGRDSAALSPDGLRFAASSESGGAWLFDLTARREPLRLGTKAGPSSAIAFSGDGAFVVTTQEGVPELWDCQSGELVQSFSPPERLQSVALDRNGGRLAYGVLEDVHLIDVGEPGWKRVLSGHPHWVTALAFSPDGARLAAGTEDGSTWIWDSVSGELLSNTDVGQATWKHALVWRPDGMQLLSGAHGTGKLRLWDASLAWDPELLRGHASFVYPVRYTPDGTRIVSGDWQAGLRIWSSASGRFLAALQGHTKRVADIAISPDGTRCLSVSFQGRCLIHDLRTGALVAVVPVKRPGTSVAWSADDRWIAVAVADDPHAIQLFDAASLEPAGSLEGHTQAVNTLAFDPTGGRLASGSQDGSARVWELPSGPCRAMRKGVSYVHCVAWSPDGRGLVLAGYSGYLEIVDPRTLAASMRLDAHPREVFSASFSPDGNRLFSGGRDGRLFVWDVKSGALVGQFEGHRDYIWSLAVHPDGTRVATGSGDHDVRQWESEPVRTTLERRLRSERLMAEASARVERLFADLVTAESVVEHLEGDASLDLDQRDAALACALARAAQEPPKPVTK